MKKSKNCKLTNKICRNLNNHGPVFFVVNEYVFKMTICTPNRFGNMQIFMPIAKRGEINEEELKPIN